MHPKGRKGLVILTYEALGIMRAALITVLFQAVAKLQNFRLHYGKKAVEARDSFGVAIVVFHDGSEGVG